MENTTHQKPLSIFNLTYQELEKTLGSLGCPRYRAQQVSDWLYKKLVFEPENMINLPLSLRVMLREQFDWAVPCIAQSKIAGDGSHKVLLQADDDKLIEAIVMPEKGRVTLCVSCMVGCPLKCRFCATGSQVGFIRKLSAAEIIGQYLVLARYVKEQKIAERITNIVFMGMGEPLLNRAAVETVINLLTHDSGCAISPKKISVSTAGVCDGLADFIHTTGVRLAVSLHFPTDELRSEYMPINRRYSLADLCAALAAINLGKRDHILIEYMLLGGINDSREHARKLHKLVAQLKVKINLIPYNPTELLAAQPSDETTINAFALCLKEKGHTVTVRRSRGADITGACGQFMLKA